MRKNIVKIKCFFGKHNWKLKSTKNGNSTAHRKYRYECKECKQKREREFYPNGSIDVRKYWSGIENY